MSVTITAVSSDEPFKCVAANIPGLIGEQRETIVALGVAPDAEATAGQYSSPVTTEQNVVPKTRNVMMGEFQNNHDFIIMYYP